MSDYSIQHAMSVDDAFKLHGFGKREDFEASAKTGEWHDYGQGQQYRVVPTPQNYDTISRVLPLQIHRRRKPQE